MKKLLISSLFCTFLASSSVFAQDAIDTNVAENNLPVEVPEMSLR